jgi:hypothetical protein
MALTCRQCGSPVRANRQKLAVVLGGSAAVMLMGAMMSTPVGWLSVIPAVLAGSRPALKIMQMKMKLAEASRKAGGFFWCDGCQRDVPVSEVFGS